MRTRASLLIALALTVAACHQGGGAIAPRGETPRQGEKAATPGHAASVRSSDTGAFALLGYAEVENYGAGYCAGKATLEQGSATVNDSCFSGDSNIVMCTDTTAPNPIRCAAGKGMLTINGTGSDVIDYARVR